MSLPEEFERLMEQFDPGSSQTTYIAPFGFEVVLVPPGTLPEDVLFLGIDQRSAERVEGPLAFAVKRES